MKGQLESDLAKSIIWHIPKKEGAFSQPNPFHINPSAPNLQMWPGDLKGPV